MKKQVLIATMLTAVAMFAGSVYAADATHGACVSTSENPSIGSPISGSTYEWGIEGGDGSEYTITPTVGTAVTIEWLKTGVFTLWSQETSEHSCIGPKMEIEVTVSSFTALDPTANNICSILEDGTGGDVIGATLPVDGWCGGVVTQTIDKWIINSIDNVDKVTPASTNAQTSVGLTDKNAIFNDKYTNDNPDIVVLTYHITPYADSVEGTPFKVEVSVYPQVKKPVINW